MVRVVGPFERMLYPLSQRRAHFNRNKARIEKVVLHHRREKVALCSEVRLFYGPT